MGFIVESPDGLNDAGHDTASDTASATGSAGGSDDGALRVALINNMPDAALLQTERQFGSLLEAGSGDLAVRLRRYTLPGVPRGETVTAHIDEHYFPIETLRESRPHAVIVTGSDPRELELTDEPYWSDLVEVIDWAQEHTASTIVSCLSAHALLFSADGVARSQLADKCHGVFDQTVERGQPMTDSLPTHIQIPHSRRNDVPTGALTANGYLPLVSSAEVGWTVAQKQHGSCLLVLMQGHPEYEPVTLLLEYRRDVRRYVLGERTWYPPLPAGYLPAAVEEQMVRFRDEAIIVSPLPELMDRFPFDEAIKHVLCPWRAPAEQLYVNWLREVERRVHTAEVVNAR